MTDMTSVEQPTPKPTDVVKSPEPEHSTLVVTFVYRGANPFMRFLVDGITSSGFIVDKREISDTDKSRFWKVLYSEKKEDKDEATDLIGGKIKPGVIVTDNTLHLSPRSSAADGLFYDSGENEGINAYDVLESSLQWRENGIQGIADTYQPIFDEIKAKGKNPVVLEYLLDNHLPYGFSHVRPISEELREDVSAFQREIGTKKSYFIWTKNYKGETKECIDVGRLYADIFRVRLGIPIIDSRDATMIVADLKSQSISPESAVLLYDHHVTKYGISDLPVENFPICPCCIGRADQLHGKHFPLDYRNNYDQVLDQLKQEIRKKEELLEEKKREKEQVPTPQTAPESEVVTPPIPEATQPTTSKWEGLRRLFRK